ncbi:MAG TPA: hypothetical protein VKA44_01460 [Gemmatimonadota bacterium]|nr:hypothetical protein [Gemmatimonadota bacterium]
MLLCDAQTSGGLLAAVPAGRADGLVEALRELGYDAARIGSLEEGEPRLEVRAP